MKRLGELLNGLDDAVNDLPISGMAVDSRQVKPGTLFVALKGVHHDGHDHGEAAVRAGAVAIVAEKSLAVSVPVLVVPSTLAALSGLAARV